MQYVFCISAITLIIIIFKIAFGVKFKEIKKYKENKRIGELIKNFPNNIQVAKEILEKLQNSGVKVEEAITKTQTSLYIAVTNKIIIAPMENNYARIQTIAHECIHSCQNRKILLLNFIISNINIIYFILISIFTCCGIIENTLFFLFILTLLVFTKIVVRSFLEIEAMTKSYYVAKEYIKSKKICTVEEEKLIIQEYSKINKVAILATLDNLIMLELIKLIIYSLILFIF